VPAAWENILDVWYNSLKGHNPKNYFGIYDVVRFDTSGWIRPYRESLSPAGFGSKRFGLAKAERASIRLAWRLTTIH
jgi:hypothetical protein